MFKSHVTIASKNISEAEVLCKASGVHTLALPSLQPRPISLSLAASVFSIGPLTLPWDFAHVVPSVWHTLQVTPPPYPPSQTFPSSSSKSQRQFVPQGALY